MFLVLDVDSDLFLSVCYVHSKVNVKKQNSWRKNPELIIFKKKKLFKTAFATLIALRKGWKNNTYIERTVKNQYERRTKKKQCFSVPECFDKHFQVADVVSIIAKMMEDYFVWCKRYSTTEIVRLSEAMRCPILAPNLNMTITGRVGSC